MGIDGPLGCNDPGLNSISVNIEKSLISERDNLALIDLDGTVADYNLEMRTRLAILKGPDEPDFVDRHDNLPSYILARRDLIKRQPGFWKNLPRLELGFEVVGFLKDAGFRLTTLTKCPQEIPEAWKEKIEWSLINLPDAQYTLVSEDKSIVYGKILVDDYPPYFNAWLKVRPRGLVIAVAQPCNIGINQPNVIRYDGNNKAELIKLIEKVRKRTVRIHK